MIIVTFLLFILTLLCLLIHIFSLIIVFSRRFFNRKKTSYDSQNQSITILRPVSGLENNLERTLESAFLLNHPQYEIIFCVSKDTDPVIPLVKTLMTRYPNIKSSLLIGEDVISKNPKLNNLVKGWKAAHYRWIVMSDSNVLMPKNYFNQIFARWIDKTGLVVSPPLGTEPQNFAADLEAAFLNSYQARWQLTSDSIGHGFAQGKTLFWCRDVLDRAGGINALSCELAEDAAATKIVRDQGLKVRLTAMPFGQPLGKRQLRSVWNRQLRWAKLRRDSFPAFFYLEILSGFVFPAICLFFACLLSSTSFMLLLWFFIGWYMCEFLVTFLVGWPFSLRQALAQLTRDMLLPLLWLLAFSPKGYQWQGHKVDIKK